MEVLKRIEPPWFDWKYSLDGCELLGCDCSYFRDKVLAAGFTVAHGGCCGHDCAGNSSYQKPQGHQPRLDPDVQEGLDGH